MAETSLCFISCASTISPNYREISPSFSSSTLIPTANIHHRRFSFFIRPLSSRFSAKASSGDQFEFGYGSYPWDSQFDDADSGNEMKHH
ncbi:Eukaryotic peptide chain release factor subunit 1 [Bienertia sinuspersici]